MIRGDLRRFQEVMRRRLKGARRALRSCRNIIHSHTLTSIGSLTPGGTLKKETIWKQVSGRMFQELKTFENLIRVTVAQCVHACVCLCVLYVLFSVSVLTSFSISEIDVRFINAVYCHPRTRTY